MYGLLAILLAVAVGVRWARRHPSPFPPWLTPLLENPLRRLVAAPEAVARRLDISAGQRVLEIGPGGGLFTAALGQEARGALLVCLDLQPEMLRKVRGRLNESAPPLVCGDAAALPFAEGSICVQELVVRLHTELSAPGRRGCIAARSLTRGPDADR